MSVLYAFRDLLAERRDSAQKARNNAWDEFLKATGEATNAQKRMDTAHRQYMDAERDLERANGR